MDRLGDLRRCQNATPDEDTATLERLAVYLDLIDHAESRAQSLAGMAGTALGVFFAAFIAAFVSDTGTPSPALRVADLVSEILFVGGAFLLLRCIFQALSPADIEDPWDEKELEAHWRQVDGMHERAARNFWIGTVMLAVSIGVLIAADILTDLLAF
jgi:hypothetical protein